VEVPVTVFLLFVIIAILLFGGSAVLGVVGAILGGVLAVGAVAYIGMHFGVDHDAFEWSVIALLASVSLVGLYFGMKDTVRKRREREAYADKWDDMLRQNLLGDMTAHQFLEKYPNLRKYYDSWLALGRKTAE